MGKLVFAAIVFVVGYALYVTVQRQRRLLPTALAEIVPRAILAVAIGIPALIVLFSICRIIPDGPPEVYKSIGLNYSSVIIDPAAQEVLKAQTATHNAAEILVRRQAIKFDVQSGITQWLTKYGVELKEASLANIRFDANYEKA